MHGILSILILALALPSMAQNSPSYIDVDLVIESRASYDAAMKKINEATQMVNTSKMTDPTYIPKTCPANQIDPSTMISCNADNDYLEPEISRIVASQPFQALKNSVPQSRRLLTCIERSQKQNTTGHFGQCRSNGTSLTERKPWSFARIPQACQSQNSIQLAASSFAAATDCLAEYVTGKNDPEAFRKSMFTLLSQESGFNFNSISHTGAAGTGQLDYSAIKELNTNVNQHGQTGWAAIMDFINHSNKASCKAIHGMNPMPFSADMKNRCELVSLKNNNPLSSLVYAFAYQKDIREQINKSLNGEDPVDHLTDRSQSAWNSADSSFKSELISQISIWSYNVGPAIKSPLTRLLNTAQGRHLLEASDLDGTMSAMPPYVKQFEQDLNSSSARVAEASGYYQEVQTKSQTINNGFGRSKEYIDCGN